MPKISNFDYNAAFEQAMYAVVNSEAWREKCARSREMWVDRPDPPMTPELKRMIEANDRQMARIHRNQRVRDLLDADDADAIRSMNH